MARKAKGDGNGNGGRAAVYTLALILAAFAVMSASSFLLPGLGARDWGGAGARGSTPPFGAPQPELGDFFTLRLALSVLNVVLVVYLLFVYVKDYLRLKSSFTLGLVAFLFSFLMYALSSLPVVHMLLGPFGIANVFSFVPMLFSAIGLVIFVKLSNE
ncbi:MAG: hypothetical protein PHF51_01760 [Candidatus ainarchaeum sp.]|nr:hypothetical protein [Candidatus ainarchaeum sp.]